MVRGLSIAALALAVAISVEPSAGTRSRTQQNRDSRILTSSTSAHLVAAEHAAGLADLAWLDMVQAIGAKDGLEPAQLRSLANEADLATDLDPRYFTVYYAVASVLAVYALDPDGSDRIAAKGARHLPDPYQFPFLLGWSDYFLRGDAEAAAKHWTRASRLEDAPHYLASLAGRAMAQALGTEEGVELLSGLLGTLDDPALQRAARERIQMLRSEPILAAYDRACDAYFRETGRFPDFAGRLFLEGRTAHLPVDRLGFGITLDTGAETSTRCVARTKVIRSREFEARARLGSWLRRR